MTAQAGLCQTCSETTLLVFPRGGSFVNSKVVLGTSGKHVHEINNPLYPSFIYFNWGLHGYTFFLFFVQNIDCGYSLEPPHSGGGEAVLMCTHDQCFEQTNGKYLKKIHLKFFIFKDQKISV